MSTVSSIFLKKDLDNNKRVCIEYIREVEKQVDTVDSVDTSWFDVTKSVQFECPRSPEGVHSSPVLDTFMATRYRFLHGVC